MLRMLLFLPVLLSALPLTSVSVAQTPSPTSAAKLRRLLPLPERTLSPKLEISTYGIGHSLDQGFLLTRQMSDHSVEIAAIQRRMTGRAADAGLYRQLGGLYRRAGLPLKSKEAFQQSEILYKAVLAQRPNDGLALAGYGETMEASGQSSGAEAYLRKAAQTAPDSADVWMALGSVLSSQALPKTEPKTHLERDAGAAYSRAVLLAPRNPAVWAERGDFRSWTLPRFQGKFFSRDGLSDYERAADLSPHDPYAQAMVPTIDYIYVESHYNLYTSPEATAKETPAAVRLAKTALRRLTHLAQSTTGAPSASAYAARAWVQFQFCYDPKGAQKSERLALQQNPNQQDAIDYQMHVAAVTGDHVLLAAACRRELRRRPAVYLRVLLAYADYYLAQQKPEYWREGLAQLELAHAAQPNDYACALGLAVFLLKSGQTARADLLLTKIAPQGQKRPKEQQAEYDVTRGIGGALMGRQEEARRFLGMALKNDPQKNDPQNKAAQSALALLPVLPQPQQL